MRRLARRRHQLALLATATRCSALTAPTRRRRPTVRYAAPVTPRIDATEDSDDAKPHYPLAPSLPEGSAHPSNSLEGEIAVRRNEKNHRDVDIDLRVSLNGEHGSYDLTQQYKLR